MAWGPIGMMPLAYGQGTKMDVKERECPRRALTYIQTTLIVQLSKYDLLIWQTNNYV